MPSLAAVRISAPRGAEGRRGAIAVVTALCLALAGGPAWAASPGGAGRSAPADDERPVVMVWPGEPAAPVDQAEAVLRAEGIEVVPRAPVREAVAGHRAARTEREQAQRERVEEALEVAQARYLELDFEAAIATLDAAQAEAIAVARPGRCEGLWELAFRQGLGRWAAGEQADARARFELALALDAERRPLGELYGPDVTAAFLQAVEARSARLARPVPLRVVPTDAAVELDCRAVDDRAPSVLPGLHVVRVTAPGFRPWAGVVDLGAEPTIEVVLEPVPASREPARRWAEGTDADAVDDGSTSAHAVVLALAHAHGAEAVLVVGHDGEGVRVRPWGRDGIGSAVERGELEPALRAALGLLDADGELRAPAPSVGRAPIDRDVPGPTSRRRTPVVRTWWFWTIVGGVAAGTTLGLGLGLGLREPAPGRLVIVAR
jgi:hypothetical protein